MVNNKRVDSYWLDYLTQSKQHLQSAKFSQILNWFPLIWYIVGLSRPNINRKFCVWMPSPLFFAHPLILENYAYIFLRFYHIDSWRTIWAYCFSLRRSWRFLEIQLPSLLRVPFPHPFPRVPGDPRPIPNRSAEAVWRQNINSGPSR